MKHRTETNESQIPYSARWRRYQGKTSPLMVRITAEERDRWTARARQLEFYNVQAWIAYLCNRDADAAPKPPAPSKRKEAKR